MKKFNEAFVVDFLNEIELKYDLFSLKIDGVYIWEVIRIPLFLRLIELSQNQSFQKNKVKGGLQKIGNIFLRICVNVFLRNPILGLKKVECIIFESGRKYLFEGEYVDIYTYFKEKEFVSNDQRYLKIEIDSKTNTAKALSSKNLDALSFCAKIFANFINVKKYSETDHAIIKSIESSIFTKLGLKFDLNRMIKFHIKKFKSEKPFFKILLLLRRPKEIYFVNYLNYFALCDVAKSLHIKTIELQHGLIIKESLTYHFPNVELDSLKYFPNEFHVWPGFIGNTGRLPISRDHIKIIKENHLEFYLNKYSNIKGCKNNLLIASQPFFSELILDYIYSNACTMPEYNFYYKLHPMEFDTFLDSRKAQSLIKLENVKLIKNEVSVYELLKKCRFTIGIYSTLLFEAPKFGSTPLILYPDKSTFSASLLNNNVGYTLDEHTPLLKSLLELL